MQQTHMRLRALGYSTGPRCSNSRCHRAVRRVLSAEKASSSATPAPSAVTCREQLPPELANAVAVLQAPNPAAPGGMTRVFVLGVSHVSERSCDQTRQLVRAVRPEVVLVELCKERVGLLVDPVQPDRRAETWHCRRVTVEGVPDGGTLWPTHLQLLELVKARIGTAITTQDIEADVALLLATGLFGKARPLAENAGRGEAPRFGSVRRPEEDEQEGEDDSSTAAADADAPVGAEGRGCGDVGLQLVPPLGSIKYVLEPRILPLASQLTVRLDSSMRDAGVQLEDLQSLADALLAEQRRPTVVTEAEGAEGSSSEAAAASDDAPACADGSLALYLRARAALADAFPNPGGVVVSFSGVESGRAEALVRARLPSDAPFVSGLEGSAAGGEGIGIEPFRPQRSSVQLSPGMMLPAEAAQRLAAARAARQAGRVLPPPEGWSRQTNLRLWRQEEVQDGVGEPLPPSPVTDGFARVMTGLYARLQAAAGDAAGVTPGAAWRAALEAACEVGSQQVLLGDRPTDVSQRRLAAAITGASGGRLAAALGVLIAGVVATATHALPSVEAAAAAATGAPAAGDAGILAGAVAAAAALAWPVLSPFAEVWRFGQLSGEQVEDVVAIKEPLQERLEEPFFVWGEDALLRWPGALTPLIDERDDFMARVLAAAATGTNPNVPAYVADEDEGQLVWRYMVPAGASAASAPAGAGDGEFVPLPAPAAVVAVVGSAHVRGMARRWSSALNAAGQLDELMRVE